jgi:RNA polymerase sigma factor (sigma-70 family)
MTLCYSLFNQCIDRHQVAIKSLVVRYLGTKIHEPDDFIQELWIKLNKHPESSTEQLNGVLIGDLKSKAWFFHVVRNLLLDLQKKEKGLNRRQDKHAQIRPEAYSFENSTDLKIDLEYIRSLMKKEYQHCFDLYMQGMKGSEIAQLMNKSTATISNMLKYIRQFLADQLIGKSNTILGT